MNARILSFLPLHCLLQPPPPTLCCVTPSPLYRASASLVIGCCVGWWLWFLPVMSPRRVPAFCFTRTEPCRDLLLRTGHTGAGHRLLLLYVSELRGIRTMTPPEVRASHHKILWMFAITQLTTLTVGPEVISLNAKTYNIYSSYLFCMIELF